MIAFTVDYKEQKKRFMFLYESVDLIENAKKNANDALANLYRKNLNAEDFYLEYLKVMAQYGFVNIKE